MKHPGGLWSAISLPVAPAYLAVFELMDCSATCWHCVSLDTTMVPFGQREELAIITSTFGLVVSVVAVGRLVVVPFTSFTVLSLFETAWVVFVTLVAMVWEEVVVVVGRHLQMEGYAELVVCARTIGLLAQSILSTSGLKFIMPFCCL